MIQYLKKYQLQIWEIFMSHIESIVEESSKIFTTCTFSFALYLFRDFSCSCHLCTLYVNFFIFLEYIFR